MIAERRTQNAEFGTGNPERRTRNTKHGTRNVCLPLVAASFLLFGAAHGLAADAAAPADSVTPVPVVKNTEVPPPQPQDSAAGKTKELEGVVVTASRTARDADTIPANVTVITAEQIANTTAQSVPDVLKHEAGITVSDYLGNGRTTKVDVRGFGETADANTLVMVDGRRMNPADLSGVDWTTIPLERIERIEIVRGGGSVLYGDQAVGGVINIITKKGAEKNTLTSETTVGSYHSFKQALGFAGSHGPFTYALNGSYADSDGYRDNGGFRNKTTGLSLGYDDPKRCNWFSIDGNAGIKEDRYGIPGGLWPDQYQQNRRGTTSPNSYATTDAFYLQATPKFKLGDDTRFEIGLSHAETASEFQWGWGAPDKYDIYASGIKPKLTMSKEIFGMAHEFTAGVDYTHTQRKPVANDWYPGNVTKNELGGYLNDTVALVPEKLFLDLGYRRSRVNYNFENGLGSRAFGINSYRAGLTYAYAPQSKLFISADRSFRTMVLDEQAASILPPQTSWQYQAGVKHFFNRYVTLGATVFEIDTTDEIFYDPNNPPGWGSNTNYPKTRRRGLELSAESDPLDTVHLFANYTWMNPQLQGGDYNGNRIPLAPTHSAQAGVTWSPLEQIDLDLRARWMDNRYSMSDWGNVNPDWDGNSFVVVDTKVTYKPTKWLKLYVGINNILNEEYAEYGTWSTNYTKPWPFPNEQYTYPSPKRNFVAGMVITKEF